MPILLTTLQMNVEERKWLVFVNILHYAVCTNQIAHNTFKLAQRTLPSIHKFAAKYTPSIFIEA